MRFKKLLVATLAVCSAICMAPLILNAQQTMNNDAVIKLVKAGLSEDLILSTINSQPGTYDTSTDGLIALKKAGVSDKVVGAIVTKSYAPAAAPTAPIQASGTSVVPAAVNDVGVYYKDRIGVWGEIPAEVVNWKTGGAMKHFATGGMVKGDVNGYITGNTSHLFVVAPLDIIVYVGEGHQIGEYQLLRLHPGVDGREFRSYTGGLVHSSGGAERDYIYLDSKKIASRTYEIIVPASIGKGEYGILPPAVGGGNIASSGTMYTFSVSDPAVTQ